MSTRDAVKFRINIENLRVDGEECLYLLPQGFVDSILSIQDRLQWAATWENDNGDRVALSDGDRAIIETGITRLCNPMDIVNNITVNGGNDSGGCCCGGSEGYMPVFPNPTDFPPPKLPVNPIVDDGEIVPDGFDTREDYDVYKCLYAERIVEDFIESVGNLQIVSGIATAATGIAAANVLFVPSTYSAVVAGLVAAGLSITGGLLLIGTAMAVIIGLGAVAYDKFDEIFDHMTANKADFICAVYNAGTVQEARQIFIDKYGEALASLALDDGISDGISNVVDNIVDAFVPSEILVGLFQFVKDLGVGGFDCSTCGSEAGTAEFPFTLDEEGWDLGIGRATYVSAETSVRLSPKTSTAPHPVVMKVQIDEVLAKAGITAGTAVSFPSVELDVRETNGTYWADGKTVLVIFRYEGGTSATGAAVVADGVVTVVNPNPTTQAETDAGGNFCLEIHGVDGAASNSNSQVYIDRVTIPCNEI